MTRRQRHVLGLAATLAAGLGAVWAASSAGDPPTPTDAGTPLEAAVGEAVEVVLRANPSTGYEWRLLSEPAPTLRLDGHRYAPDQPVRAGSGGHDVWRFHALAPGTATLRFGQFPPGGDAPADTARFTVITL